MELIHICDGAPESPQAVTLCDWSESFVELVPMAREGVLTSVISQLHDAMGDAHMAQEAHTEEQEPC